MKRSILILLLILFASCAKEGADSITGDTITGDSIKIAIYDGTPRLEYFTTVLNSAWAKAGHKEELKVVPWDNYDGLPEEDAALLIYDGVFYSALRSKGLLHEISSIPARNSFDWVYTLSEGDKYAVPFLLCSSFLVYPKSDATLPKAKYITDVKQEVAVPLRSMCTYYYIGNLIAKDGAASVLSDLSEELDETALAPVKHMAENWLGSIKFENASLSNYDGPARFDKGTAGAIFCFSETISDLSSQNLAATLLDPFPDVANRAFNVDYISVRSGLPEAKTALCEDLIDIISSETFQYEYLNHEGRPLYGLPANNVAFTRLADEYPLYSSFYSYASSATNRPMVLGPNFYEQQDALKQKIRSLLMAAD